MGGSTTLGMGVGTVGLGWSQMAGSVALGTLNEYPAVLAFQITYNLARSSSQSLPAEQRITGSAILEDSIYAGETDTALQKYITYLVRRGHTGCGSVTSSEVRTIGPSAVRQCLVATGMADAAVSVLQQARDEWKRASPAPRPDGGLHPPTDPYASSRTACAAGGGTWSDLTHTCTPAPPAVSEGLSTGMWILLVLIGAAVAAVAYGVYGVQRPKTGSG